MTTSKRQNRVAALVFFLLLAGHLGVIAYTVITNYQALHTPRDIVPAHRDLEVPNGATLTYVLEILHERKLAPNPFFVRLSLLIDKREIVVKKGPYTFPEVATTLDILDMLHKGLIRLEKLTVREGYDKWETAEFLGATKWGTYEEFLALINDPTPVKGIDPEAQDLEGYLMPETYHFPPQAKPKEIVLAMVQEFIRQTEPFVQRLPARQLTVREWVALASLIEEETGQPEERAIIAGVFANRLAQGMLLQCDPTIIYALKLDGKYKGKIYKSQIQYKHPYNTYVYGGLPPGPISNPGLDALKAAFEPEETPYLYFVSKNDGSHYFSKTLREHNRAVRNYRRERAREAGK